MAIKDNREMVTCAGAIVFRMGNKGILEFLLIKPSKMTRNNEWGFPKGHMDEGESIEQCAIREVYEETGVVPRLIFELPPVFTKNTKEYKTVHFWLAKQLNEKAPIRPQPEEVSECRWFPITELPKIHGYQKSVVNQALEAIYRNLP